MADLQSRPIFEGFYDTQMKHPLRDGIVDGAIADYVAIATKFGTDAIKDGKTRARYMQHIKELTKFVRKSIAAT